MPLIEVNGISVDVESHGDAQAPAVLLIMGLAMPSIAWPDEFIAPLVAAGLRVIRFDNRDCGASTKLGGQRLPNLTLAIVRALLRMKVDAPYSLNDMAGDAVGVLDALGVARAHVVGASMGGMIAQQLAALHPQRVLSLTSIMSSTGNPNRKIAFGSRRALGAILARPKANPSVEELTAHLTRVFAVIGSPSYPPTPEQMRAQMERVARRGYHPDGSARQMLAILRSGDRRAALAAITAPTLVLHGADDPLVPLAAGLDTARNIRDARFEVIPGMGHDFAPALQSRLARAVLEHVRATMPVRLAAAA
jgi:proline iminopeptidase